MKKLTTIIAVMMAATLIVNAQAKHPTHKHPTPQGYSTWNIEPVVVYPISIGAPVSGDTAVVLLISSTDNLADDTTAEMTIKWVLVNRNVKPLIRGEIKAKGSDYSNMSNNNSKIAAWVAGKIENVTLQ